MTFVLITVPCPKLIYSDWWQGLERWRDESSHRVEIFPEPTPNRMDKSISNCIAEAKKRNPDLWIRLDADVRPGLVLDDCVKLAFENKKAGFDVTCSPTLNEHGVVQAKWIERGQDGEPVLPRPYLVEYASGSLVLTPKHVFQRLEPVGEFEDAVGNKMSYYIQVQRPSTTEDWDYCERVRALGFTVVADTRLLATQNRPETGIPSLRVGMTWAGTFEVALTA